MLYLTHLLGMKGRSTIMMGRNHLICGISAAGLTLVLDDTVSRFYFQPRGFETPLQLAIGSSVESVPYLILSGCLFLIGCALPDIDSDKSLAGRFFHLPVCHRGITHTIWMVLFFGFLSIAFRPMFWLTFGYFLHLLLDSVSAMGVLWLYPFRKYREYPSGARVAPGHRIKLYHTSGKSETVFVAIFVCICIACVIGLVYFL